VRELHLAPNALLVVYMAMERGSGALARHSRRVAAATPRGSGAHISAFYPEVREAQVTNEYYSGRFAVGALGAIHG
jgi:hypothetical protein